MIQIILLAGVFLFAYKIYQWTKCPKELAHLPVVNTIAFHLNYELSSKSFSEKMKAYQPILNEHGVFRVWIILLIFYNMTNSLNRFLDPSVGWSL
jgi:hypothetical protein